MSFKHSLGMNACTGKRHCVPFDKIMNYKLLYNVLSFCKILQLFYFCYRKSRGVCYLLH